LIRLARTVHVAIFAFVATACASTNLVLRARPGGTGANGPLQRCVAGEQPCATDPSQDESRFDPSNASFISLPNCANGIDRILVQDANTSHPVAIVQCAAPNSTPETGIPTADGSGGVTPSTDPDAGTRRMTF
jgi:hypothetical protein